MPLTAVLRQRHRPAVGAGRPTTPVRRTARRLGWREDRAGRKLGIVHDVTAFGDSDRGEQGHPLAPGASPGAIRANLLPEDQPVFEAAFSETLDRARASLDLNELFGLLERWRRIAALQADPQRFASVAQRAAQLRTGESVAQSDPLPATRAKAGL